LVYQASFGVFREGGEVFVVVGWNWWVSLRLLLPLKLSSSSNPNTILVRRLRPSWSTSANWHELYSLSYQMKRSSGRFLLLQSYRAGFFPQPVRIGYKDRES
jgi:hypothetical protein